MVIERTKKEVIFKVSSSLKIDDLQDISDYLELKEILKESKACQKDIDILVKEVKKGRWEKTKKSLGL